MSFAESFPPNILLEIRSYPGNDHCCDCRSNDTDWCSISHGTLICLGCAGKHRSLGVLVSFVRSISMDSWSKQQVEMMRQGGNEQIKRFFRKLEIENSSIQTLYCSKGANHYRERLKEKVGKIMSGELKSESRVAPHSARHRNTRSQSAIADLMLKGANSGNAQISTEKRQSSFEQYHVTFGEGPMGMTISKDFGGRALVSKLIPGGPADRSGVMVGDHITGVAKKRLDDYDEIMHMIPCLTRPITIQFTRRVENHYIIQAGANVLEPTSPGVNRSIHGSKSMANMSLNLAVLDAPTSHSYKSKARIRTPRSDSSSMCHIAEADGDEEEFVRSPENASKLVKHRSKSKDSDSSNKLIFTDPGLSAREGSIEFLLSELPVEAPGGDIFGDALATSETEETEWSIGVSEPPIPEIFKQPRRVEGEESLALADDRTTTSSQQSSPLFIDLSSNPSPLPPPTPGASPCEYLTPLGGTTDSKGTRSHSVDLCKQIDELLEDGFGRLSLDDVSAVLDSPGSRRVSRHSSAVEMVESPEIDRLSSQHVLFSGEGLTKKLTLHTLQNGTPIKVLRNDVWKSASLRRKHRDGSFKVIFRDGSTEAHVPLQRLAMTTDTLKALSDWHTCTSASDAYSDERLEEAYRSASREGEASLVVRRYSQEMHDKAEIFSSPESSSYATHSVHSFRPDDLLISSEDFIVARSEDLDSWINDSSHGNELELERGRTDSLDSVLSDNHKPKAPQSTFAAEEGFILEVMYFQAPLGMRLSSNRSNASSATNSPMNRPKPAPGTERQPEITKVVPGGRSDLEGVRVGDVLVQIEGERVVDYTHAMRILQSCVYPITLRFRRSLANITAEACQSGKSIVEDLLGVQKGPPLACSPPQTTRTAIRRLSVPKIELSVTPEDSPHRESASAHRREQLQHHQKQPQQQLDQSVKTISGGSVRPTEYDDNSAILENNNSKNVSQSSDGTTIVPPLMLGISSFPVNIDDLEICASVSERSNRSTEVDSAEGCCSAELSADTVNVSEVAHNELAKKNVQIELVDVDRRIEN